MRLRRLRGPTTSEPTENLSMQIVSYAITPSSSQFTNDQLTNYYNMKTSWFTPVRCLRLQYSARSEIPSAARMHCVQTCVNTTLCPVRPTETNTQWCKQSLTCHTIYSESFWNNLSRQPIPKEFATTKEHCTLQIQKNPTWTSLSYQNKHWTDNQS